MKIAFIGGGNMAAALIAGLRRADDSPSIHVVEVDAARRADLTRRYAVSGSDRPDASLHDADAVVLAVKPQQLREACEQCRPWLRSGFLLSIAAGIPVAPIVAWSGRQQVVRAMPNTPALIGAGVTGLYAAPGLPATARSLADRVMRAAGETVWFDDEGMMDAVTAISGSGPAYVFYLIEALQTAATHMGMTPEQARALSIGTFRGASLLAAQSDEPVQLLRERVTSKGGTTAAALEAMRASGLHDLFVKAAFAALERGRELGKQYGER